MIRTTIYWLVFWLYQVFILPSRWLSQWLKATGRDDLYRRNATRQASEWSHLLLFLSGSRIERKGQEHLPEGEAVLLVSNHQGEFDIPLILSCTPYSTAFVAKKELRKVPFVGFWMAATGCEFLDRGNRRQMVEVAKSTAEKLKNGISMVVFPEGTRSNEDKMGPFKKGSLSLADRAGVKIVPIAIKNSHRMKKKGSMIIQKVDVVVEFLPAIDPSTLSDEEKDTLHLTIHERIQEKVWTSASGQSPDADK